MSGFEPYLNQDPNKAELSVLANLDFEDSRFQEILPNGILLLGIRAKHNIYTSVNQAFISELASATLSTSDWTGQSSQSIPSLLRSYSKSSVAWSFVSHLAQPDIIWAKVFGLRCGMNRAATLSVSLADDPKQQLLITNSYAPSATNKAHALLWWLELRGADPELGFA